MWPCRKAETQLLINCSFVQYLTRTPRATLCYYIYAYTEIGICVRARHSPAAARHATSDATRGPGTRESRACAKIRRDRHTRHTCYRHQVHRHDATDTETDTTDPLALAPCTGNSSPPLSSQLRLGGAQSAPPPPVTPAPASSRMCAQTHEAQLCGCFGGGGKHCVKQPRAGATAWPPMNALSTSD